MANEKLKERIDWFRNAYDGMFAEIDTLSAEQATQPNVCGVWSVKQIVDHCSGWIVEAEERFTVYDTQEQPENKRYDDFDEFNAQSVADRADQSWASSQAEIHAVVAQFIAHAEKVLKTTEEPYPGYAGWLKGLAVDCEEHTKEIKAFVQA